MPLSGRATLKGTETYTQKFPENIDSNFYCLHKDRWISSIGLGTYLGDATNEVDRNYQESIKTALANGINLIDTASNYRFQRSERLIGDLLPDLIQTTDLERDQIVVATKGGFVPYDGSRPEDPLAYLQSTFIEPGLAEEDDFTNSGHCLTPDFIEYQVHCSLKNLDLETIDLFYVHNPEMQFAHRSHEQVFDQLEAVFELLEEMVKQGKIASYGVATWDGLRVSPEQESYLKLESVHELARRAGGENHHFEVVQLPFNLGMKEASTLSNQPLDGEPMTTFEACRRLDLSVMTSASIMQGKIDGNIPDRIRNHFNDFDNDVLRALQFNRSTPGVTAALIGMSSPDHVKENLDITRHIPLGEEEFQDRFLEVVED